MYLASSAQIKQLDHIACDHFGLSPSKLMEQAAEAISQRIGQDFGFQREFAVFCGRGNNGGDGLLTAGNLKEAGAKVLVYLTDSPDQLNSEAKVAYEKAKECGVEFMGLSQEVSKEAIIIDALLGISVSGAPEGSILQAIKKINALPNQVISIDVPSGVNVDNGRCGGEAITANVTYTLALDKIGLNVYPGFGFCGRKELLDIGIPFDAVKQLQFQTHLTDEEMVQTFLPSRDPNGHKGNFGKVGIIGGSVGMSGSVCLAAKAAMRSGAGMCYLFVPEEIHPTVSLKMEEAIVKKDSELSDYLEQLDAIAIGMGYAQNSKMKHIMKLVMQKFKKPVVIDGDALNMLSDNLKLLKSKSCSTVLTPHAIEFSRLTKMGLEEIRSNRIFLTSKYANEFNSTLLLKGAKTVISSIDSMIRLNPTGNSGMATAGSGDVLSGVIAGLLAQGAQTFEAACLGAYLHGLSGDLAAADKTEYGMIAGDLVEYLPSAIKKIIG